MVKEKAHQLIHILADLDYLKTTENNQVMLFRNIPKVLQKFLESIWRDELIDDEVWQREPLFDQLFINWYLPGEGIVQHVDLPVFDDGILSLSLGDPCLIYFDPIPEYGGGQSAELILRHLDGLTISSTARYKYSHRIDYCEDELSQDGIIIERGHRVSLTMRRMVDN
jgi:alkylated DNA repair dioxygenase AlkB